MTEESSNTQQVPQCLTTEHFMLQTARAAGQPLRRLQLPAAGRRPRKQNRNPTSIH
ncbi:hypothetical protein [Mesorhizobium sp.]|uniref:hypothetical protein n=1 Tax=Mesorhizobium sp. TaxID=1871066 RepID=UPI0025EA2013|nr:hypothetical protein [Mesorhizobium sp.]